MGYSFSEIAATFPGRDLSITGQPNQAEWVGIRDTTCPTCGKGFAYTPGKHAYTRKAWTKAKNKRLLHFCSWSCLKTWDELNPSKIDAQIRDRRKRLDYLEAQKKLPPEERTVKGDIKKLIERADIELNRAITRRIWEAV